MSDYGGLSTMLSTLGKIAMLTIVFLIGRLKFSVAWMIPVIFSIIRGEIKEQEQLHRAVAREAAQMDERDAIFATTNDLPAWVHFPDVERVEWINKIAKQIWPKLNHFVEKMIREMEPKIKEMIGGGNFKIKTVTLGSICPRISGIKVYDRDVFRDEIIIELNINYVGDSNVTASYVGMDFGVTNFVLEGVLRIVLRPLTNSVPFFGRIHLYFMKVPLFDFNLTGGLQGVDLLQSHDFLRAIIGSIIKSKIVMPNKIVISLCDTCDTNVMPEAEGVVQLKIHDATGLVPGTEKQNVYCAVRLGSQSVRTEEFDADKHGSVTFNWNGNIIVFGDGDRNLEIVLFRIEPKIDEKVSIGDKIQKIMKERDEMLKPHKQSLDELKRKIIEQQQAIETNETAINDNLLLMEELKNAELVQDRTEEIDEETVAQQIERMQMENQKFELKAKEFAAKIDVLQSAVEVEKSSIAQHDKLFDEKRIAIENDSGINVVQSLKTTEIGKVVFDVDDLLKEGSIITNATLDKPGNLYITLKWMTLSASKKDILKYNDDDNVASALLSIYIDSVQNLSKNNCTPYLMLNVGDETAKTQHAINDETKSMQINELFTFFLKEAPSEILTIKVIDQATEKILGEMNYKIKDLVDRKNMENDAQTFHFDNNDTKLIMSLSLKALKESSISE